ncbi:Arm DNA-binding domain-containing protein [Burkholderia ubonensis]|uniref:Arm DNA-binding domain-containing protein n=1 Tax=Burkholderia ubonensis TaxID=101571 RepID=UPI001E363011|nr:Arm DNA-binding domain-containing protein [Burkholderia ubonensis]
MPRRVEPKSEVTFRAAKARARPYLLADGNGLALRVWPNGSKTWLFRYRRPGTAKENFLSLGPYPDISLLDARKAAAAARDSSALFDELLTDNPHLTVTMHSRLPASDRQDLQKSKGPLARPDCLELPF